MTYCNLGHYGCPAEAHDLGVTVAELHRRNRRAFDRWEPLPERREQYAPADTSYADRLWGAPIKKGLFR